MDSWGFLSNCNYFIDDCDSKFCKSFFIFVKSGGVEPLKLPPQCPNLNSFSERLVRSVKEKCLLKFIFFGEDSLRKTFAEYTEHYYQESNHQGKDKLLLFPNPKLIANKGKIKCRNRLTLQRYL